MHHGLTTGTKADDFCARGGKVAAIGGKAPGAHTELPAERRRQHVSGLDQPPGLDAPKYSEENEAAYQAYDESESEEDEDTDSQDDTEEVSDTDTEKKEDKNG